MIDGPLFSIGKLHFYPYGMCMAIGIIACFVFLLYAFTKRNFNDEAIDKILIIGIGATLFGVFMAMVFQALYDYIEDPTKKFSLGGSMTFQGGLIGGVASFLAVWNLYIFVIAPRAKSKVLSNNMNASLSDALPIIPMGITIAHAFGRLGCTFAGCCHGAVTDKWYGIYMYTSEFGYAKVVPTQLFECLFLAALTGIMILLFFKWRFKYNMGLYLIAYGAWRFVIEFARDDHRGTFIGSLTPSQFWSIIMIIAGIGYIFLAKYLLVRFEKHPEKQPPVRQPKKKKALATVGADDAISEENNSVTAERTETQVTGIQPEENVEVNSVTAAENEKATVPSPEEKTENGSENDGTSGGVDQTAKTEPDITEIKKSFKKLTGIFFLLSDESINFGWGEGAEKGIPNDKIYIGRRGAPRPDFILSPYDIEKIECMPSGTSTQSVLTVIGTDGTALHTFTFKDTSNIKCAEKFNECLRLYKQYNLGK